MTLRLPNDAPPVRHVLLLLATAAAYFGSAKLGLTMAFVAEQVTPVWPPTGIALAVVLLLGYRIWPGIWLGAFLANVTAHEPLATACGIASGNTLEAVAGGWLLHRYAGFGKSLERLKDVGLPGLDGYAVARSARETPGGDDLFLVAITGTAGTASRRIASGS